MKRALMAASLAMAVAGTAVLVVRLQQQPTSPFDNFFGIPFGQQQIPQDKQEIGGGSGFVVRSDGLIVTNKHVVQPWKFDPDLMALAALGEIEIDESSARIAAWQPGDQVVDGEKSPLFTTGFNNVAKRNLRIFALCP